MGAIICYTRFKIYEFNNSIDFAVFYEENQHRLHRIDGPAIDVKKFSKHTVVKKWWLDGKGFKTEEEFKKELIKYKLKLL